jgi:O-antigen ligase
VPDTVTPREPSRDRPLRAAVMIVAGIFLVSIFFSIAVNSISLGVMGVLWLLLTLRRHSWRTLATPLDWFFLAYGVAELLSSALSPEPAASFFNARRLLLLGIVYFFASSIQNRGELRRFFWVLEGAAILVACLGIVKVLTGGGEGDARLGVFQFYMTTSGLMACSALLLLPVAVHRGAPRADRWGAIAGLVPILFALYATVTRGAYMAFVAGALLVILVRDWRLVIPLTVLVIITVFFAPPYVAGRIQSIVDPAHPENVMRIFLWTAAWRIFTAYPVFGVGDIDLGNLLRQYADPGYLGLWGHAHNVLLQFLATLGAIGTLAVGALFVRLVRVEWRIYRLLRDDWLGASVALGALAVFTAIMVQGLTEWTFGDQEIALFLWTTVGFALAAGRLSSLPASEAPGGGRSA